MYRNDAEFIKLKVLDFNAQDPWMGFELGEGGKGIENHGRSRVTSFSQETRFDYQLSPRIGGTGSQRSQVQDARDSLTQLPIFFLANQRQEVKTENSPRGNHD